MDDYIMISTSKEAVLHFLQKSHQKFKLYGGRINPLKTRYVYVYITIITLIVIIINDRVNFDAEIECDGQRVKLNMIPTDNLSWYDSD